MGDMTMEMAIAEIMNEDMSEEERAAALEELKTFDMFDLINTFNVTNRALREVEHENKTVTFGSITAALDEAGVRGAISARIIEEANPFGFSPTITLEIESEDNRVYHILLVGSSSYRRVNYSIDEITDVETGEVVFVRRSGGRLYMPMPPPPEPNFDFERTIKVILEAIDVEDIEIEATAAAFNEHGIWVGPRLVSNIRRGVTHLFIGGNIKGAISAEIIENEDLTFPLLSPTFGEVGLKIETEDNRHYILVFHNGSFITRIHDYETREVLNIVSFSWLEEQNGE